MTSSWAGSAFLVLALLIGLAAPPPPRPDLDKLIGQLSDDDLAVRRKAMKDLEGLGEEAVEALKRAARDPDPDVRLRAFVVLRAIHPGINKEDLVLTGHTGSVVAIAISRDGTRLLSGGNDSTLRLWDLKTGLELRQFAASKPTRFWACAIAPDGKHVLGGGSPGYLGAWEADTGKLVREIAQPKAVRAVAFLPDGKRFMTGSYDKVLRLYDFPAINEVRKYEGHTASIMSLAVSPDGKLALTGSGQTEKTARLWDIEGGKQLFAFNDHTERILGVTFTPDSKQAVTGCWDNYARIYDTRTGKRIRSIGKVHNKQVASVAVSPDGKLLATGGDEGNVVLLDLAGPKDMATLQGHTAGINQVHFSADGKMLASSAKDNTIRVWRLPRK